MPTAGRKCFVTSTSLKGTTHLKFKCFPFLQFAIVLFRTDYMQWRASVDEKANKLRNDGEPLTSEEASFTDWLSVIKERMLNKMSFGNLKPQTIEKEVEHFIQFGNCAESPSHQFQPFIRNISLLTTSKQNWQVDYLACPFNAYFPVSFEDQQHLLLHFPSNNNAYNYCKAKLQQLVTELRARKNRIIFHFHSNYFFELDILNPRTLNKFQIVHCLGTSDSVGLANLIPVAARLMTSDNPGAVLLTEADSWHGFRNTDFIIEYIKRTLCCYISMIPTIYGMRLAHHLELGCSVPAQFHDGKSANGFILKWQKAPSYSSNVKLIPSNDIMVAALALAQTSFIHSYIPKKEEPPSKPKIDNFRNVNRLTPEMCEVSPTGPPLPYKPLTYFYVWHSVINRCGWMKHDNSTPGEPLMNPMSTIFAPSELRLS